MGVKHAMGVYRCLWEPVGDLREPVRALSESMDKYEYEDFYDCYGSLCVFMGVYERLWGFMGICGLTMHEKKLASIESSTFLRISNTLLQKKY